MPEREIPENCTCGAQLVENARFCHRCGRPVFEIESAAEAETPQSGPVFPQAIPTVPAAHAGPLPVGFGNPVAVRVAVVMSLATMLMEMIPGVNLLFLVWGLAAGWCAVLLYRRLTGHSLSVKAGARLGSITGILTFLSLMVVSALTIAVMGKDAFNQIRQDPQVAQVFNDPPALIGAFLVALVILFAIVVGTCAAGGALGARFAGRHGANNQA